MLQFASHVSSAQTVKQSLPKRERVSVGNELEAVRQGGYRGARRVVKRGCAFPISLTNISMLDWTCAISRDSHML